MIINTTETPIETSGISETANFGIQQSQKAFKILSGLYSDIHLAIVRELACNAIDAHAVAGNDEPISIHLPNTLEPWLTIEDFGTGIAHKDIYDIYTVYFASTKTNTNSQIGCMGLGSKSPFAYTDNFTIQSTVNGERRIYGAFFDSKGMPSISLMGTTSTTEKNGVKIQIPVKPTDFEKFQSSVFKACRFFSNKPIVKGGTVRWDDEFLIETDEWKTLKTPNYGECYAVMGGVSYPIDLYKINDVNLRDFLRNTNPVMFFNMGELDFTPSREALEYGELTINSLTKKAEKIKQSFLETYNKNLQKQDTVYDALFYIQTYQLSCGVFDSKELAAARNWKGIDLSMYDTYYRNLIQATPDFQPDDFVTYISRGYGRNRYNQTTSIRFDYQNFYVDDLVKGKITRIRQYQKDSGETITVISQEVKKTLLGIGMPEDKFKKLSDLPAVQYNRGSGSIRNAGEIIVYEFGNSYEKRWDRKVYDSNVDKPEYYIVKKNAGFDFNIQNKQFSIYGKRKLSKFCEAMKIQCDSIVLTSQKNVKTLEQNGVKSLEEFVKTVSVTQDDYNRYKNITDGFKLAHMSIIIKDSKFQKLDDENPFKKTVLSLNKTQKLPEKFELIQILHITVVEEFQKNYSKSQYEDFGMSDYQKKVLQILNSYNAPIEILLESIYEIQEIEKKVLTPEQKIDSL